MKILVTGGCGFIGSHLAEAFCREGHSVVVLDDLSTGTVENLKWRTPGMDLDLITADAGDENLLKQILPNIDQAFHLAALPSVQQSILDPSMSHEKNLNVTLKLLLAANNAGVDRLIFASSCAVYGNALSVRTDESSPVSPMSPYALQKLTSEYYLKYFYRFKSLPTVSLRLFNVYGSRQSDNSPYSGVISQFCSKIICDEPISIFGDGTQTRDFIYISDVIQAIVKCSTAPKDQVAGKCFNVATGESHSLNDLTKALNIIADHPVTIQFLDSRPGDIQESHACISAAKEAFEFNPKIALMDGLRSTLAFLKESHH